MFLQIYFFLFPIICLCSHITIGNFADEIRSLAKSISPELQLNAAFKTPDIYILENKKLLSLGPQANGLLAKKFEEYKNLLEQIKYQESKKFHLQNQIKLAFQKTEDILKNNNYFEIEHEIENYKNIVLSLNKEFEENSENIILGKQINIINSLILLLEESKKKLTALNKINIEQNQDKTNSNNSDKKLNEDVQALHKIDSQKKEYQNALDQINKAYNDLIKTIDSVYEENTLHLKNFLN